MKSITITMLLILFPLDGYSDEVLKNSVTSFLVAYSERDYSSAASQVFCPFSLTPKMLLRERRSLADEIGFLTKDYTKPVKVRPLKNTSFTTVTLVCSPNGDVIDIKKPTAVDRLIVEHSDGMESILEFYYYPVNGHSVIGMIGIGEASI